MFLAHVADRGLLARREDTHIVQEYSPECQVVLCRNVVEFLANSTNASATATPAHVAFSTEIVGHCFALPLDYWDIIKGAIGIYSGWLATKKTNRPPPECMDGQRQEFIQSLLDHTSMLFVNRAKEGLIERHADLCKRVLNIMLALGRAEGPGAPTPETWDRMLRLLLGMADQLLTDTGTGATLGNLIEDDLTRVLIELYLLSLGTAGPHGVLWDLLAEYAQRWRHRLCTIQQWKAACMGLNQRILNQLYGPSEGNTEVVIYWNDSTHVSLQLPDAHVKYAWHRMLHMLGNVASIPQPSIQYAAVQGACKFADMFTHVGASRALAKMQTWDQTQVRFSSGGAMQASLAKEIPPTPPDGNSVLRAFGPWIFDAALNNSSSFETGRAEALGCLGRIFCGSGGRHRPFAMPHLRRFYVAVVNGFAAANARVTASLLFNCRHIFSCGLPGVHSLVPAFMPALRDILVELPKEDARRRREAGGDSQQDAAAAYAAASEASGGAGGAESRAHRDDDRVGDYRKVDLRHAALVLLSGLINSGALLGGLSDSMRKIQPNAAEVEETAARNARDAVRTLGDLAPRLHRLLTDGLGEEDDTINLQIALWALATFVTGKMGQPEQVVGFVNLVRQNFLVAAGDPNSTAKYAADTVRTALAALGVAAVAHREAASDDHCLPGLARSLSNYVRERLNIVRSSRSLMPVVDDLVAATLETLQRWVMAAPWAAFGEPRRNIVEVALLASDVLHKHRPAVLNADNNARQGGVRLLLMLQAMHSRFPAYGPGPASGSSLLTEDVAIAAMDDLATGELKKEVLARTFCVNHRMLVSVVEVPDVVAPNSRCVVIVRDSAGKFAWRAHPFHDWDQLDAVLASAGGAIGAAPSSSPSPSPSPSPSASPSPSPPPPPESSALESKQGEDDEGEDPLLHAVRACAASLHGWKRPEGGAEAEGAMVTEAEGNASRSRQCAVNSAQLQAAHADLAAHEEAERGSDVPSSFRVAEPLSEPQPQRTDQISAHWHAGRQLLAQLGFTKLPAWGSMVLLAQSGGLTRRLRELDDMSVREEFEVTVVTVEHQRRADGSEHIGVSFTPTTELETPSPLRLEFDRFMLSLGWLVDLDHHPGFKGAAPGERGHVVYWSDADQQAVFHCPSLPLHGPASKATRHRQWQRQHQPDVLVVWNEHPFRFRPGSTMWKSLGLPDSQVFIVIDPLPGGGLCRVRVACPSPLFVECEDMLTPSPPPEAGNLVLGPLVDGSVVPREDLGRLVRETALNASRYVMHRRRAAQNKAQRCLRINQRKDAIREIEKQDGKPTVPSEFYSAMFAQQF